MTPAITTTRHRCWQIDPSLLINNDERDQERREAHYQRQLAAHPDPRDPEHPEDIE